MNMLQLLLKDNPVLNVEENGTCTILDFDHLPFALRRETVTLADFMEWASNRTLSIGRSYAKEILNTLRMSQTNRYAVCKACRGLSLEDAYWILQEGDRQTWADVNLFENPLSLFVAEVSLSGTATHFARDIKAEEHIHTPELTTLGVSAKAWIRHEDGIYLHKVGKYEIPADIVLQNLGIEHISYFISGEQEIDGYLSEERKAWLTGVGEKIVHSKLFTSPDTALVTFEEFRIFCEYYGLNPFEEAMKIDRERYLKMQIADYLLNNMDRHEQNWGFLMDVSSGKITGYCPLFDHDHAFSDYENVMSQTTEDELTLYEAAARAQAELKLDLSVIGEMERPPLLTEEKWQLLKERMRRLL